jgi:hypothetical protein
MAMTASQIEQKFIELIHQEPFEPFEVQLKSGHAVVVPHPRLAINEGGAGFIGPDGGLIDIDFAEVWHIRTLTSKAGK